MAINKIKNEGLKMKKTTLSIFGILALTAGLCADVPYTFTPYTPAKASEVNANFQALSDKITTLEDNAIDGGTVCEKSPFKYTYSYISSNIGDTITVNNREYVIVAMPFIEYGTGDHYYVKYPVVKVNSSFSSKTLDTSTSISTNYVEPGNTCFTHTFAGYPARDYSTIYYNTSYNASMADPAETYTNYRISNTSYHTVQIKINQTEVNLQYYYLTDTIQDSLVNSGDVDMTDNIDWSKLGVDTALVDSVKMLMNYVEVVKIP